MYDDLFLSLCIRTCIYIHIIDILYGEVISMHRSHLEVLNLDSKQGVKVAAEHGRVVDAPRHKLLRE